MEPEKKKNKIILKDEELKTLKEIIENIEKFSCTKVFFIGVFKETHSIVRVYDRSMFFIGSIATTTEFNSLIDRRIYRIKEFEKLGG